MSCAASPRRRCCHGWAPRVSTCALLAGGEGESGGGGGLRPAARGGERGRGVQARGVVRVRRGASVGEGQRVFVKRRDVACAAESGHLAVLRWAREHGCHWDSDTRGLAAKGGHLEVLLWAVGTGCHWMEDDVFSHRWGRAHGGFAVGAYAQVPLGQRLVWTRRKGWTPAGAEEGAGARLPAEREQLCPSHRSTRARGGAWRSG